MRWWDVRRQVGSKTFLVALLVKKEAESSSSVSLRTRNGVAFALRQFVRRKGLNYNTNLLNAYQDRHVGS